MTTGPERIVVQNRIDFVTGAVRRYVPDVDALTQVAARLQELFAGRSNEELRRPPSAGEWSAARTLGHMIAYTRVLHDQLNRMAYMTDPELPLADDAGEAEREQWETRDPGELLRLFVDAIGEVEGLLKHLPDSSWGRAGLHPLAGRRSIVQQAREAARHLRAQVEQIEAALAQGDAGGASLS